MTRRFDSPWNLSILLVAFGLAVLSSAWAQEQIGTWTLGSWTDPDSGAEVPSISAGTQYGIDGQVHFICDDTQPSGRSFVLEADEFAESSGSPVLFGIKFDLEPELGPWAGLARSEDGTALRYDGPRYDVDPERFETILAGMREAVSPVFMVAFGPMSREPTILVLESAAFSEALTALPCSP